jgi:hypothetical protein
MIASKTTQLRIFGKESGKCRKTKKCTTSNKVPVKASMRVND